MSFKTYSKKYYNYKIDGCNKKFHGVESSEKIGVEGTVKRMKRKRRELKI